MDQELALKTDWMQRLEQAPPGTLVKEGKNQVTVTLPRPPKEHHWPFWLIIVAIGLLGTEHGLPTVIVNVVGCAVLYLYWWRTRWSVVFYKNRLVVRHGVGFLSKTTELRYEGLECEFDAGEISLFNFADIDTKSVVFSGDPWLFQLLEGVGCGSALKRTPSND